MLTVEMTLMPGVEQLVDVLPSLVVPGAGHVGVGELVDEYQLRSSPQDGVDVHLVERRVAVLECAPWDDLEVTDLLGGARAAVGLDEADDDIGASLVAAPALVEHGERLADAGSSAEVDAQHTAPGAACARQTTGLGFGGHTTIPLVSARLCSDVVECEVELQHVDAGITEDAERSLGGVLLDEGEHIVDVESLARRRRVAPAAWRCAPRCAGRARNPRR